MFDDASDNIISDASQNDPSVAFGTTAMMGYMPLQIVAPTAKFTQVQPGYPQLPYIGFEWTAMFSNATTAPISPGNILPGSTGGQTVINGQYTIKNEYGNTQMVMGYQQNGFL